MQYLQIQIKGYRALADVTLDLHPLTVMIGPNGCGKTSLLEIFQILKDAAEGRLGKSITNLGGLNTLLTHASDAHPRLEIAVQADMDSARLPELMISYRFALEPRWTGYKLALEKCEWPLTLEDSRPYYIENDETSNTEVSLVSGLDGQLKAKYGESAKLSASITLLRFYLTQILHLGSLDVSPRAPVRLPQPLTPAAYPGQNGESLFAALYHMRETSDYQSAYQRIEEALRLAFPGFDHLGFPVVGAGQITLIWQEKNLSVPLYPNQLSEGTLRFLWLAATLLSPKPPPLILIDEPEISLHPELLQILAALMRDASARTQLLVATHSSDFIRWLRPYEVVVIDKQDGKSTFTWADDPSLNLEEWLKEYTLADLWYMGNLGGRT